MELTRSVEEASLLRYLHQHPDIVYVTICKLLKDGFYKMLNTSQVLDRFADYLGADTDGPICEALGVSRSSISSWRARGSIPYRHFVEFAKRDQIDLNWLFLGIGNRIRELENQREELPSPAAPPPSTPHTLLDDMQMMASLSTHKSAWKILKLVSASYPAPCSLQLLAESLGPEDKLEAHLQLLAKQGVLRVEAEQVQLNETLAQLVSRTHPDTVRHALELIQAISSQVVPAVEQGKGKMLLFEAKLAQGSAGKLAKELVDHIKAQATEFALEEGQEDSLTIVLALAIDSDQMLTFDSP